MKVGKFIRRELEGHDCHLHDGSLKVVSEEVWRGLGVHIIGPYATEIIAGRVTALELRLRLKRCVHDDAHPTVAEALLDGFSSVEGMAVTSAS